MLTAIFFCATVLSISFILNFNSGKLFEYPNLFSIFQISFKSNTEFLELGIGFENNIIFFSFLVFLFIKVLNTYLFFNLFNQVIKLKDLYCDSTSLSLVSSFIDISRSFLGRYSISQAFFTFPHRNIASVL